MLKDEFSLVNFLSYQGKKYAKLTLKRQGYEKVSQKLCNIKPNPNENLKPVTLFTEYTPEHKVTECIQPVKTLKQKPSLKWTDRGHK